MDDDQQHQLPYEHEPPMPEGDEPPPPGTKVMAAVRWLILAATVLLAVCTWWSFARSQFKSADSATTQGRPKYHCPMHPQIVSDEPGECPICHMQLEHLDSDRSTPARPAAAPDSGHAAPGSRTMFANPNTSPLAATPGVAPPGLVPITLALDRIQSIGVRTAVAAERELARTLRVTATVSAPEQGVAEVHVRTAGFVEWVSVAQTGIAVRDGQMLAGIYSPELYQAQAEFLTARRWSDGDAGPRASDSARVKLGLLGMSDGDINRIIERGEPARAVPVYAPQAGVISKKNVVLGSYVTPETTLYEIEDLSRVYVVSDVFQRDVASLRVGMEGQFATEGQPATVVAAKVDLIYPSLNVETRTTRVRMQIHNGDPRLAPGEYGTVEFALPKRTGLVIPRDAVVDTGVAAYVFVAEGEGRFSPRSVSIGQGLGDEVAIDAGISAGDRVVSGAAFLIDSESRLQASARAVPMGPVAPEGQSSSAGTSCNVDFDRAKFPDKWTECQKCVQVHHGMGSMEADCKNAIAKPWK
jgi:Cu(I)/Ag(I) efflux system membrane fusion protein